MMGRGGASSGGAQRGISAADDAASGWLQRRSSACSREASKMMGRAGASSGGAPLHWAPLRRGGARVGRGGAR
jgi:hypothetical protein